MQKSKKSSKNKKPIIIFIYGPQAVGKFTVAKILNKKLGYKFAHNHHINDFVDEIFIRGTSERNDMVERLRYNLLESAIRAKINLIVTHCYSHDFISSTGLSDPKYVQTLEKRLVKLGGKFCGIHLKASNKELLRRVGMSSRKEFNKITSKKRMRELLLICDWQTSPKLKNNLIIDNTKLSPQKVADIIIKHFKLKF